MGVPFEKANNASYKIQQEIDYLSKINPFDIFPDTEERLESSHRKLGALLYKIKIERAND